MKGELNKIQICTPNNLCTNLSSKYGSGCASQKKPLWDSSKTYSPKGFTFREVRLMPYFHNKLLFVGVSISLEQLILNI